MGISFSAFLKKTSRSAERIAAKAGEDRVIRCHHCSVIVAVLAQAPDNESVGYTCSCGTEGEIFWMNGQIFANLSFLPEYH